MVLLTFRLGAERYGVDVANVVKVLPSIHLKSLPQAPAYVAGIGNMHGASLPVIDLCQLALGRPCQDALSTRIIQVNYPGPFGMVRIGLLAEAVSEVIRIDPSALVPTGVQLPDSRYLGPVINLDGSLLQQVSLDQLLPEAVLELLVGATLDPTE